MYGVFANSMDAVSDRDFVLEALFAASCTMMHLSRLCEDIIMWAHPAHGYVRLPDTFATGSSMAFNSALRMLRMPITQAATRLIEASK